MQLSRFLAALGVFAIALIPIMGRSADTDAQVKARETLRSKLNQLDSQTVATNTTVAPATANPAKPTAPPPQPAPAAAPEPQSQPVVVPPQPAPTTPAPQPASHPIQTPLPAETVPARGFAQPAPPASA